MEMGEKELDNQRRLVAECWSGGGSSVVIGPLPSTSCPDALAVVCHERFLSRFLSLSLSLHPSRLPQDIKTAVPRCMKFRSVYTRHSRDVLLVLIDRLMMATTAEGCKIYKNF